MTDTTHPQTFATDAASDNGMSQDHFAAERYTEPPLKSVRIANTMPPPELCYQSTQPTGMEIRP